MLLSQGCSKGGRGARGYLLPLAEGVRLVEGHASQEMVRWLSQPSVLPSLISAAIECVYQVRLLLVVH